MVDEVHDSDDLLDLATVGLVAAGLIGVGRTLANLGERRTQQRRRVDVARLLREASEWERQGRVDRAAQALGAAVRLDPDHAEAANAFAWLLVTRTSDRNALEAAEGYIDRALRHPGITPSATANYLDTRGEIHLRRGEFPSAVADFERALRMVGNAAEHPGPSTCHRLGIAYVGLGQLHQAREALSAARDLDPGNLDARVRLADVCRNLADHDAAITELLEAYRYLQANRKPDAEMQESGLLNDLGMTCLQAGRDADAAQCFSHAAAACDGNPYPIANLALLHGRNGDAVAMRRELNKAVSRAASFGDPSFWVGLLGQVSWSERGDVILDVLMVSSRIPPATIHHYREEWRRRTESARTTATFHIGTLGAMYQMSGDSFTNNQSSVGAQGTAATNYGVVQQVTAPLGGVDLSVLREELSMLQTALVREASEPDHYHALAEIESAKQSAGSEDEGQVAAHLKKAGRWALDTAVRIGAPVAEAALRAALQLPG
jgi:tetratricopeptide (TPR) repeat protein